MLLPLNVFFPDQFSISRLGWIHGRHRFHTYDYGWFDWEPLALSRPWVNIQGMPFPHCGHAYYRLLWTRFFSLSTPTVTFSSLYGCIVLCKAIEIKNNLKHYSAAFPGIFSHWNTCHFCLLLQLQPQSDAVHCERLAISPWLTRCCNSTTHYKNTEFTAATDMYTTAYTRIIRPVLNIKNLCEACCLAIN